MSMLDEYRPLSEMSDEEVIEQVREWNEWCRKNPGRAFMLGTGWARRLIQIVEKLTDK